MNENNEHSTKKRGIMKWGILGTGRIAHVFASALQSVDDAQLYAVGSRSKEKAEKFANEYGTPCFYDNYEALLSDPEINVVYIATPHHLHLENTMLALEHGKHVLCEKPLGVNQKEVITVIEKAASKKLFLMEALWSRFLPNIIKTKELVENGTIGDVNLLTAYFSFLSKNGPEHRHFNIDLCGGTILDIGIYNIFLAQLLLGKPLSIYSMASLSEQGVDTTCSYSFKYRQQQMAVMYSSFLADAPIIANIYGSKGSIALEHRWFAPGSVVLTDLNGNKQTFSFEEKSNGYQYEAIEVQKCILESKTQSKLWSWNDSLRLVETMDIIRNQCNIIYPKHDK
jgi:predicted dehydrogenase